MELRRAGFLVEGVTSEQMLPRWAESQTGAMRDILNDIEYWAEEGREYSVEDYTVTPLYMLAGDVAG